MKNKDPKVSEQQQGVFRKYSVKRLRDREGKHRNCEYFVLDPKHDPFAVAALRAYADACAKEFPALASDLHAWALRAAPKKEGP